MSFSNYGGYEVWSNGQVVALDGSPFYGSPHVLANNVVGFEGDIGNGYWLVTATGHVYSEGSTCEFGRLVAPKNAPHSAVVGAINLKNSNEGFNMVTGNGRTYGFTCKFPG